MKYKDNKIRRGNKIIIDKGILGKVSGTFVSVRGMSAFGLWGLYKDDEGKKHIWDETVHKIIKL